MGGFNKNTTLGDKVWDGEKGADDPGGVGAASAGEGERKS